MPEIGFVSKILTIPPLVGITTYPKFPSGDIIISERVVVGIPVISVVTVSFATSIIYTLENGPTTETTYALVPSGVKAIDPGTLT